MPSPQHVSVFQDELGNEAYLVIDTVFKNSSVGGVRIHRGITLEEVKQLARNMSYKLALFDIPIGGAKMGIRLKDDSFKKTALVNFEKRLRPYIKSRLYLPGKDLGTTLEDIALVYQGVQRNDYRQQSSYYTAIGIDTTLDFIRQRWNLKNLKIALSGFGRVGYFLVKEFIKRGISLAALSNEYGCIYNESGLDKEKLIRLQESFGSDWIFNAHQEILPKEALYSFPVEVLIPGADIYAINKKNIAGLSAKFICPVANLAYEPDILGALKEKKITAFPDFVTNAGGVLGAYLLFWGLSLKEAEKQVRLRMQAMLAHLCENNKADYCNYALGLAKDKLGLRDKLNAGYHKSALKKAIANFLLTYLPRVLRKAYYHSLENKRIKLR